MKQPPLEYQYQAMKKNGMSLSVKAVIELMQAVHAKGLPFRFNAGGHSMAPFIRDGDVICVSPLASRAPNLGDVVAFIHPETKLLCVHRVVSVKRDSFFIQGDNMPENPDGMIPRKDILGRVTRVEHAGKMVRLGLGPERPLLALLSYCGLLAVIRRYAGPLYTNFCRSRVPCEKN